MLCKNAFIVNIKAAVILPPPNVYSPQAVFYGCQLAKNLPILSLRQIAEKGDLMSPSWSPIYG